MLAWLVVEKKQQGKQVNSTNGSKEAGCLCVVGIAKGAANCVGAIQQIAEGCARFDSTEIGSNSLAIKRQVIDKPLDEVAAVDRC